MDHKSHDSGSSINPAEQDTWMEHHMCLFSHFGAAHLVYSDMYLYEGYWPVWGEKKVRYQGYEGGLDQD